MLSRRFAVLDNVSNTLGPKTLCTLHAGWNSAATECSQGSSELEVSLAGCQVYFLASARETYFLASWLTD